MNVIVIGGGAAGMMAAIMSARNGNNVTILEKMRSMGRKLSITGKGRCNITNATDMENFMKNVPGNGKFLYSAFSQFTNQDVINFFNEIGVKTKVERGERVFPVSDSAMEVIDKLKKELEKRKVKVIVNSKVEEILVENGCVTGVRTEDNIYECDKVILATGGKSYPSTGSTGDGYKIAEALEHTIVKPKASLVPLELYEKDIIELQGLSLKNVSIKLIDNQKVVYEDFGEMLFTHFGVSGPIVLSASSYLVKTKNIEEILKSNKVEIEIDLKPALTEEKLDARILRDFEEQKNKQFKNSLDKLLPQKLIPVIIEKTNINENKKVNEITKLERQKLVNELKHFKININGTRPIEEAIITSGGISVKEINPKTMESKLIKGLYFAGEIIDVDCLTGGYNLQVAWSTGYTAGIS